MKPNIDDTMDHTMDHILDECIEGIMKNKRTLEECLRLYEEERSELEPLLVTTKKLIKESRVMPDAEKKQRLRDQLIAAVEQKRLEASTTHIQDQDLSGQQKTDAKFSWWKPTFLRLGIATLILVILCSGTLAVAKESLPGNYLYPLKLAIEKARISLANNDDEKARLYLMATKERINELKELGSDNKNYPALIKAVAKNIEAARSIAGENNATFKSALVVLVKNNGEILRELSKKASASDRSTIEKVFNNDQRSNDHRDIDTEERKHSDEDKKDSSDGQRLDPKPENRITKQTPLVTKKPGAKEHKDSKASTLGGHVEVKKDKEDIQNNKKNGGSGENSAVKPSASDQKPELPNEQAETSDQKPELPNEQAETSERTNGHGNSNQIKENKDGNKEHKEKK